MDGSENRSPESIRKGLEESLNMMKANQEIMEMGFNEQAKMLKSVYDAYIKAGFSEEHAFQLVLHKGINIA